jgi:hypothetical protein
MNNLLHTIGEVCKITTGKPDANQALVSGKLPFFTCAEHPNKIGMGW